MSELAILFLSCNPILQSIEQCFKITTETEKDEEKPIEDSKYNREYTYGYLSIK